MMGWLDLLGDDEEIGKTDDGGANNGEKGELEADKWEEVTV